ncbi:MAG: hypothetical protein R3B81_17435 [bacterium]
MSAALQQAIVAAAVLGAAAWLVRDWRRRRARKAACDSCALMKAATQGTPRRRSSS